MQITFKQYLGISNAKDDIQVYSIAFNMPREVVEKIPYGKFVKTLKSIDLSIPKPAPFKFNGETYKPITNFSEITTSQWLSVQGNAPTLEGMALALFGPDVYNMPARDVVSHIGAFLKAWGSSLHAIQASSLSLTKALAVKNIIKTRMKGMLKRFT